MKIDNDQKPLVSIIVRTCGRPDILENALKSIQEQDYPNIEVVLVEDGENISEEFAKKKFPDLDISYFSSGVKIGRSSIGNTGMNMAHGQYLNFLDDDDVLLSNHVTTLVDAIRQNECKVVYAIAEEHQIVKDSKGNSKVKRRLIRYKQPFNKLLLCYKNYLPIQCVMFEKSLYERFGGLDEALDVLEDWDMWLRYAMNCRFIYVPEITSVYYTPYKSQKKSSRDKAMINSRTKILNKHFSYSANMSVADVREEMEYIINEYNRKNIWYYAKKIRDYLIYKDM